MGKASENRPDRVLTSGARPERASPAEQFLRLLQQHTGERHVIVLQDFPDPDAISSAFAHQQISAASDIDSVILYADRLSHPQNIAMVRLLEIDLRRFEPDTSLKGFDAAVFVDNQGTTSEVIVEALQELEVPTLMVVDHHAQQGRLDPVFSDIRDVGATATIYAQYLEDEGCPIRLDKEERRHAMLATALMHGIVTDTNSFTYAKPVDFQAAAFLSAFRDPDLLDHILSQSRTKETMQVIQDALANREIVESHSISGVGYLRSEARDAIAQAAEFLVTEENVHTAIIYGIVRGSDGEESLVGSLRTSKLTLDPDDFLKEVFGRDEDDQYFGGGRRTAGGFEIPIGFLSGADDPEFGELKWKVYDQRIRKRLFEKIGVEESQAEAS